MIIKATESRELKRREGLGLDFRVHQRPGGDVTCQAKACPEVENYWKDLAGKTGKHDFLVSKVFQGPNFWHLAPHHAPMIKGFDFYDHGHPPVKLTQYSPGRQLPVYSLFWLRAVGLTEGVNFKMNWPVGEDDLNLYNAAVKRGFAAFFSTYLVPREYSIKITIEEML